MDKKEGTLELRQVVWLQIRGKGLFHRILASNNRGNPETLDRFNKIRVSRLTTYKPGII